MLKVIESQLRTVSKTVVYRILCTIGVGILALAIGATGAQAGTLAAISFFLGIVLYYLHDRAWNWFNWRRDEQGRESVFRSVVKTILYRIIVMIAVVLLVKLVITDSTQVAVAFAIGQFVINLILYYIVERVANRIQKGRIVVETPASV
jgi:uncharacterized membrane protein